MTRRALRGRALLGGSIQDDALVSFDERVLYAGDSRGQEDAEKYDGVLVPGFIDVHVHGGDGFDFMDARDEANQAIIRYHARNGTAALAATTLSASQDSISRAINEIVETSKRRAGNAAEIVAVHLEGPYLNPSKAGAQDIASIRPPDIEEVNQWLTACQGLRCLMTLAPEIEGSLPLLERFKGVITFSLGHTDASYAKAVEAFDHGATHVTHLLNAMAPLHQREPGIVGAVLVNENITAELIADGVHIHRALLRMLALTLTGRLALVTDAMRACGMPPGKYHLHQHEVIVDETSARMTDGTLAGSVLTMIGAVRNMVELAGLPLELAIPLATETPARILGIENRKGKIEIGYDADLLVLSPRLELDRVFIRGQELDLG